MTDAYQLSGAWAADRAGGSYRRIVSSCRLAELDQIYMDYEEYLRKKAEKLREIEKVDIMGPVNEYLDDVNELDQSGTAFYSEQES